MSEKHTPGPWHIDPSLGNILGPARAGHTDADGPLVAQAYNGGGSDDVGDANAALIAAAPALLAACRSVADTLVLGVRQSDRTDDGTIEVDADWLLRLAGSLADAAAKAEPNP